MCIDFPGRVIEREGDVAVVDTAGRTRRASTLLFPDLAVGEWVYVTAGTVVDRLDAEEARQISETLAVAKGEAA